MKSIAVLLLVLCCACRPPEPEPPAPAAKDITEGTNDAPKEPPPGRYAPLVPPSGPDSYGNFLWVVDTATGEVKGYRFARDDKKERWELAEVWTTAEWVRDDIEVARLNKEYREEKARQAAAAQGSSQTGP